MTSFERWCAQRFPPTIHIIRTPGATELRFREPDLVGCCGMMPFALLSMMGVFIWQHIYGWYFTGFVFGLMCTLTTRIRIDESGVRSERRLLGVPFQRRFWSRSVQTRVSKDIDWDDFLPSALHLESGTDFFTLFVRPQRAELIIDELRRSIRHHATERGYRD